MSLTYMFTVPLVQFDCDDWQIKKQKLNEIKNPSNFKFTGILNTDYFSQNFDKVDTVYEIFSNEIEKFKNVFSFNRLKINSYWFESASKNHFHPVHTHGAIGYSAVCYMDYCEQSHSPLVLLSPFTNFLNGTINFFRPKDVKEGTIIFFPSSILHYTDPNFSNKDRTVFSFNLDVS